MLEREEGSFVVEKVYLKKKHKWNKMKEPGSFRRRAGAMTLLVAVGAAGGLRATPVSFGQAP